MSQINYRKEANVIIEEIDRLCQEILIISPKSEPQTRKLMNALDKSICMLNLLARMQELDEFSGFSVSKRLRKYQREFMERRQKCTQ